MTGQGLMCPYCECPLVPIVPGKRSVSYTRKGVRKIIRRRVCWNCGRQFGTEERVVGDRPNDDKK